MVIVTGAEEVLHLIGVQGFVHRDGEDVLYRWFVEYGEVRFVFRFQFVAEGFQLVAVVDGSLPGVKFVTVYGEFDVLSVRTLSVRPVVVGIDFGVQG